MHEKLRRLGLPWWSSGWDCTSTAGGASLITGQGTELSQASQYSQKKSKVLITFFLKRKIMYNLQKSKQKSLHKDYNCGILVLSPVMFRKILTAM